MTFIRNFFTFDKTNAVLRFVIVDSNKQAEQALPMKSR